MEELIIRPKFQIGNILYKEACNYGEVNERIEIEDITINEELQTFQYHYSFGRLFTFNDFGTYIFNDRTHYEEVIKSRYNE